MVCKDIFGDHFVGELDVSCQIELGVVGRVASWEGTANISLPCVSLHVGQKAGLFC